MKFEINNDIDNGVEIMQSSLARDSHGHDCRSKIWSASNELFDPLTTASTSAGSYAVIIESTV